MRFQERTDAGFDVGRETGEGAADRWLLAAGRCVVPSSIVRSAVAWHYLFGRETVTCRVVSVCVSVCVVFAPNNMLGPPQTTPALYGKKSPGPCITCLLSFGPDSPPATTRSPLLGLISS